MKTLQKNILDNISYENLEFVVLNYNSKDGIDEWMNSKMSKYLKMGYLRYYVTREPSYFYRSHSKNVVGKQASGDIICNVDADNLIGSGFAQYINEVFNKYQNCYLTVNRTKVLPDLYGRICLFKKDFWAINGYDENMVGYGFEDYDLWNRLEMLGRNSVYIEDEKFLKSITHNDNERIKNEANTKEVYKIYIRYINHAVSEFLYLFKSKRFYLGNVIVNKDYNSESLDNLFNENNQFKYYNRLENDTWNSGEWIETSENIVLKQGSGFITLSKHNNTIKNRERIVFYEVIENSHVSEMIMFFSQINNRIIMERNQELKLIKVNAKGFGLTTLS